MKDFIKELKEDKTAMQSLYALIAILGFVGITLLIAPIILLWAFTILIGGLLFFLLWALVYWLIDEIKNDNIF